MNAPQQRAREVADAVLYEGFLLYPYTSGALKNQSRWQFGVLMPHGYSDKSEPTSMETSTLCRGEGTVEIAARFLQASDSPVEREVNMTAPVREGTTSLPFECDGLQGVLSCDILRDGDYFRITVRLDNRTQIAATTDRNRAIRGAFVSAHALLAIGGGTFISLLDPPQSAKEAASRCANRRVFPVLIGEPDEGNQTAAMVLASPIILYDFPSVSPRSLGHTFDGTEIDELLMLSVAAMSDEEKREARETDPRARAIVDRADAMFSQPGDRVRIHPKRRADAFDIFAEGQTARVTGVHDDVEGRRYISVVFDADPASDLHEWYGRSFFYEPDEVEPLQGVQ